MKRLIIATIIILAGCSSERADWDSGASAQRSYQQERQEEQIENLRNQMPESRPSSENAQPL